MRVSIKVVLPMVTPCTVGISRSRSASLSRSLSLSASRCASRSLRFSFSANSLSIEENENPLSDRVDAELVEVLSSRSRVCLCVDGVCVIDVSLPKLKPLLAVTLLATNAGVFVDVVKNAPAEGAR